MQDKEVIELVKLSLDALVRIISGIFSSKKKKEKTTEKKHKKPKKQNL